MATVPTTLSELRRRFKEGDYSARAERGELKAKIIYDEPPRRGTTLPKGTRSQIVQYEDHAGIVLAKAHRYLLPDGSLGGSGMPDPKMVRQDGDTFVPH